MIRMLSSIIVFGGSIISPEVEDIKPQVKVPSKLQAICSNGFLHMFVVVVDLFTLITLQTRDLPNKEEGKFYSNSIFGWGK
jgi:hypothetical protein